MQCVKPLIRMYQDIPLEERLVIKDEGGKIWQKIIPRSEVEQRLGKNENFYTWTRNFNKQEEARGSNLRSQLIPCGHCWACNLMYSAGWATRIVEECKNYQHNYFLTLTYDDEHIPINESTQYKGITYHNDGNWTGSLNEEDVKKFLNTLRKAFERQGHKSIKYYYCGEYGTQTLRPHYHMILMNCPLDLKQFYDTHVDTNFKAHWKSKQLDKWWNKGMHDLAEVEWSSAAYVARYCMKKLSYNINLEDYAKIGKIPEFVRMSRNPGIGMKFYYENKDKIYQNDGLVMRTVKGNVGVIKPPRAWDKKLQEEDPELYEAIKESRKHAMERSLEIKKGLTDYTDKEIEKIADEKLKVKGKLLPRGDM